MPKDSDRLEFDRLLAQYSRKNNINYMGRFIKNSNVEGYPVDKRRKFEEWISKKKSNKVDNDNIICKESSYHDLENMKAYLQIKLNGVTNKYNAIRYEKKC